MDVDSLSELYQEQIHLLRVYQKPALERIEDQGAFFQLDNAAFST